MRGVYFTVGLLGWSSAALAIFGALVVRYHRPGSRWRRILLCSLSLIAVLLLLGELFYFADALLFFFATGDVPSADLAFDGPQLGQLMFGLDTLIGLFSCVVLILTLRGIRVRLRWRMAIACAFALLWPLAQEPLYARFRHVFDLNAQSATSELWGMLLLQALLLLLGALLVLPFGVGLHVLLKRSISARATAGVPDAEGATPSRPAGRLRLAPLIAAVALAVVGFSAETVTLYALTPQAVQSYCLRASAYPGTIPPYCQAPDGPFRPTRRPASTSR